MTGAGTPGTTRTPVERLNTIVFGVLLVALALSFAERSPLVVALELASRAAVVVLVAVGLVRFRRAYFSHWTSYLAAVIAVLSLVRLVQVGPLG